MKSKIGILVPALLLAVSAHAQTPVTNTYSQTVNTIIPDDNQNGLFSDIHITGVGGSISALSVSLNVTNGFAGDYYAYLADPSGDFAVLLNRVGATATNAFGYSDTGFNVTFANTALNNIHFYQAGSYTLNGMGQLLGTWAPDGRNIDPESTPSAFDSAGTTANLNPFLGNDPDGTWTLFISDLSGGYEGTLANWSVTITTVPEPTSGQLLGTVGVVGAMVAWLRRRRR